MPQVLIELQTLPGFAQQLDVGALRFGLILHERIVDQGTDTSEQLRFFAFLDSTGARVEVPGVSPDLARMAQERGEETPLDLQLVRASALRLDIDTSRPFGRPALQRAFLAVVGRGARLSPKVGLTLHVQNGETHQNLACVDAGPPPLLVWSNAEWQADRVIPAPEVVNDLPAYLAALQKAAERSVAERDQAQEAERDRARQLASELARASDLELERARARERQQQAAADRQRRAAAAAAAAPPAPPHPAPPPTATAPMAAAKQMVAGAAQPSRGKGRWLLLMVVLAGGGWWLSQTAPTPSPAQNQRAPATAPRDSASADSAAARGDLMVPTGNAQVPLQDLYMIGFDKHLEVANRMLAAAKTVNTTGFDEPAAWLRQHQPRPTWAAGEEAARNEFNKQLERMLTRAMAANDRAALDKTVQLSERFLRTHFGYAKGHMNLSLALSALDKGKQAIAPAFHAVVFDPLGPNAYVALGLALARSSNPEDAAAAFCAALRLARHSDKTMNHFARVAAGNELAYPGVAHAMRSAGSLCPRERWAADYPSR